MAPNGRPLRARWVHFDRYDRHEFVAVSLGDQRVTLVREDGAIVELDAETGDLIHTWTGMAKTSGALMLDIHDTAPPDRGRPPSETKTRATLRRLIREEDGRLLPAQILAVELLWRSDEVRTRRLVDAVAERTLGPWQTEPGRQLSAHASKTRERSWGTSDPSELARRLDRLSQRPSFLADRSLSVAELAEEVVHSGTSPMVGHIVEHLMHPATPADDLPRLVAALGQLGGLAATQGLIDFMRAYHANPGIVSESTAVHAAVDTLAALLANHDPAAPRAQSVLNEAYRDPFTDPALRVHIERTLRELGLADPSAVPSHAAP
ncbi:MAG: hypothetical protein JKY37_01395 [Nannocystaceae bacterium]|nr:hypothetical protein [Nannocystaceae bacterium]